MNLVGKILVLLVLVMSLVYMGFAVAVFATHKNWAQEAESLRTQLNDQQAQNAALTKKFEDLDKAISDERTLREGQLGKLQTELAALDEKRKALEAAEKDLNQQITAATTTLNTANATLEKKLAEVDQLRKQIDDFRAERDDFARQVASKEDELNQLKAVRSRLEAQNQDLAATVGRARRLLEQQGISLASFERNAPPQVDGVVLASSSDGLIEISLGSDDGLARGHRLQVYRSVQGDARYLGEIEVLQTTPDKSVAKLSPRFAGVRLEKDDRVSTRFN